MQKGVSDHNRYENRDNKITKTNNKETHELERVTVSE